MKKILVTALSLLTLGLLFVLGIKICPPKQIKINTIPVAMASDNNYIYPTAVAITSILENRNPNTGFKFYIMISGSVSEENKNLMKNFEKIYSDCTIELIDMKDKFDTSYSLGQPASTYYRLCLPSLLKQHDKILYLDGDIAVCKDLWQLYNTDISDFYIAGVKDFPHIAYQKLGADPTYSDRMGIDSIDRYINAGVLIMNIKMLNQDNMEAKFYDYLTTLKERNLIYNDQDVMNATCYGKIKNLSPEYNFMQHFVINDENKPILEQCYKPEDWEKAQNDPSIIHYAGRKKPWKNQYTSRYSDWKIYSKILEEKTGKKYTS